MFLGGQAVEMFDDPVCFAAGTAVVADGLHQIGGAAIVEEKDALTEAPEGSGAELVRAGAALGYAVGEAFAHVVDEQVGIKICGLIGERDTGTGGGASGDFGACFK